MANKISVIIDVTVDKANRAIESFRKSVKEADGVVGKFKAGSAAAFGALKANAIPAAAAAGAAVFKLGSMAVDAASDLEQSIGAVEKSFGDAADVILEMGEKADKSLGLSRNAFNELSVRLAPFAKRIAADFGLPVQDVLLDLLTRGADMAATFGTTVPEAVAKMTSGLSGEMEPLKGFGLVMSDANVKAHAIEKGLGNVSKEAQRFSFLMDESAQYANQFADESETLAGQQERLRAELENMLAALGEDLVPIMADATDAVRDLMAASGQLGDALGPVDNALGKVIKTNWKFLNPVGQAITLLDKLTGGSGKAAESLSKEYAPSLYEVVEAAHATERAEDALAEATDRQRRASRAATEAAEKQRDALEEQREAIDDVADAKRELWDADFALTRAEFDLGDAVTNLTDKINNGATPGTREYEEASLDAMQAANDWAAAEVAKAEQVAAANGQTLTAQQKTQLYKDKLGELAGYLGGPLAVQINNHIGRLNNIPNYKSTTVETKFRNTFLPTQGTGPTSFQGFGPNRRAKGGPVRAGETYLVGEEGPELLQMGSRSGNVVPNDRLGRGGGAVYNYTYNFSPGVLPTDVENAQRRYRRAQGPL